MHVKITIKSRLGGGVGEGILAKVTLERNDPDLGDIMTTLSEMPYIYAQHAVKAMEKALRFTGHSVESKG